MAFQVTILKDSINPWCNRLTTFELTYPRCIHSEFMTHRVFSRNSSSSRAIPVQKMIDDVLRDPFIPLSWGSNKKGMQAGDQLPYDVRCECIEEWLKARDQAVETASLLSAKGLHKQVVNRLLEPWMWITVICTSSKYENFFKLRCHEAAEPHIQQLAYMMRDAYENSKPEFLREGEWHLPFIDGKIHVPYDDFVKKSVARCARGSYLQQHGSYAMADDIALHDRLSESGHWSPFEHQAQVSGMHNWVLSNFTYGWNQYRKYFAGEAGGR